MKTITPFKQLLSSEIERLRSTVSSVIPVSKTAPSYTSFSSRYTIERILARAKNQKGFLARVFS